MDPIEEHRRVVANRQPYNVHSLAEIVHRASQRDPTFGRRAARLPHSRREVTPEEAARWTAHARHTGWAPTAGAQMTNENHRIPDHLRAAAAAAELARRQQLERQQQMPVVVPIVSNNNRRFLEAHNAAAAANHERHEQSYGRLEALQRAQALVTRESLPHDDRVYTYLLSGHHSSQYDAGNWESEPFVILDVFSKAYPMYDVDQFMYTLAIFFYEAESSPVDRWFSRIVNELYEYYKHHGHSQNHHRYDDDDVQEKMREIIDDAGFLEAHQALKSRLSQFFAPLRRQIQTIWPEISRAAIERIVGDFAAHHTVFVLPSS